MFNERGFLGGIEDMHGAIATVAGARPDAIQLPPGTAPILQNIPGKDRPALVLRTDIANVYGNQLPARLFSELITDPVEQGVRLDAACVVVNLLQLPEQPGIHQACIQNINKLKRACDLFGMPSMVEPLVMKDNAKAGLLYNEAIKAAEEHKFTNECALASERASYFYMQTGDSAAAKEYLARAAKFYRKWGATRKATAIS